MTLKDEQLSFLIDVPSYTLENHPEPGDSVDILVGHTRVTRTELVGQETGVWTDYSSGVEHPHSAEELITVKSRTLPPRPETASEKALEDNAASSRPGHSRTRNSNQQSPEHLRTRPRRYSPPGYASGWIEERVGNRKRKTPTTSYYYCWQDSLTGRRTKRYIPSGKVWRVIQMVEQGWLISEILEVLGVLGTEQ